MDLIGLGEQFHEKGMQKMDESIIPQLEGVFTANTFHNVIPQYAVLKGFCNKLCIYVCMHALMYVCIICMHAYV